MKVGTVSRKGREFEQQVERLKAAFAPMGVIVTSPDFFPDRVTGVLREVDVGIRGLFGDQFGTLECRDRVSVQDATWIEQLVTKREDIGASFTIAVSSSGFSEGAVKKARHYKIGIGQTRELVPAELLEWIGVGEVTCSYNDRCLTQLQIELYYRRKGTKLSPELVAEHARNGPDTAFFIEKANGRLVTPNDLFRQYEQRHPDLWSTVPKNGECLEIRIPIEVLQETLQVKTTEGMRDVKTIYTCWSLTRTIEKQAVSRMFEYSDDHHPRVQAIEAESSGYVMSLHKDLESGLIVASVSAATASSSIREKGSDVIRVPRSIDLVFEPIDPRTDPAETPAPGA
jgi:hypothetical protein